MSTDTAAEAAERVRIRAENFPGTVSDDTDLRSRLRGIVGEAEVDVPGESVVRVVANW